VSSDGVVRSLLEKGLIEELGRAPVPTSTHGGRRAIAGEVKIFLCVLCAPMENAAFAPFRKTRGRGPGFLRRNPCSRVTM